MRTDFKTYKRKIHVWRKHNALDLGRAEDFPWVYVWSTNAYRTCRDAVSGARSKHPNVEFMARFAKD